MEKGNTMMLFVESAHERAFLKKVRLVRRSKGEWQEK